MRMSRFTFLPVSALLLVLSTCQGCPWPAVHGAGAVLGDTSVEVFSSDGKVQLHFFGKAAAFGPCPIEESAAVSHEIRLAHTLSGGGGDLEACSTLVSAKEANLIVNRGTCNFVNKTIFAAKAGAVGLLVGNNGKDPEEKFLMSCPSELADTCLNISIPAVMLSPNDTTALIGTIRAAAPGVNFTSRLFARPRPLLDPSSAVLWAIALCTVIVASFVSSAKERRQPKARQGGDRTMDSVSDIPVQDIGMLHAVGFIFAASGALVLLFFFIRSVIFFMIIIYCIASVSAFTAISMGPLQGLSPSLAAEASLPLLGKVERSVLLALSAGIAIATTWFVNRHELWAWPLQDVLSVSLCIHILSLMRFPDAKVSATLLCLALVYDIFWVFISPLLFSENVMIGVATGQGHQYNSSSPLPPPSDMIPMLLVVPKVWDWAGGVTLLGLGDVVLPGLMVSYALRMDYLRRGTCLGGYFVLLCFGYGVGLAMAIVASVLMRMGQPALLYLVPCTLGPFFSLAWCRGELHDVWHGPGGKAAGQGAETDDGEAEFGREEEGASGLEAAAAASSEEIHQRLLDKGQ